jgi:HEAT repeat protein
MSSDAVQLANLLSVLTQPDTEGIRQAEIALKPFLKDPRCVPALVEILKSKDTQVSLDVVTSTDKNKRE